MERSKLGNNLPELFSFAKSRHVSVNKVITQENFTQFLQLPISEEALQQMQTIIIDLNIIVFTDENYMYGVTRGAQTVCPPQRHTEV